MIIQDGRKSKMKIFENANLNNGWKCPVCKEGTDKPVILVKINGTEIIGKCQATQIHVDCLDLAIYSTPEKDELLLAQIIYGADHV